MNRTIQSGYSELMGLYPPSRPVPMPAAQMKAVGSEGVSRPPFGIRDLDRVNQDMGLVALPHGYHAVPIIVYNNDDIHDDCSTDGCPIISKIYDSRKDNQTIWSPYNWMIEGLRSPMMEEFNLTAEYYDA